MTVRNPKTSTQSEKSEHKRAVASGTPLKPRPLLFVLLWVILLAWLGALVWMRLRTVKRPAVQPAPVPRLQAQ